MLPISEITKLPDDIRLNPFDVYIMGTLWNLQEIEKHINEIWESLSFLPAVFNLRFIDANIILENFEDEKPLYKLFNESNIFAGVIGPRASHVRIEIADININFKNKSETEIELFLFFLQLCKSNIEVLKNISFDLEFHENVPDCQEKLEYLKELESTFQNIEDYLKDKLKGNFLFRIQSRKLDASTYRSSRDKLRFLSMPLIKHIQDIDGDLSELQVKAASLGFDVPSDNQSIDSEVKILIREEIDNSNFPGIVVQKNGKEVEVPCGYTEGLFMYTCALLYKIKNKEFKKIDFMSFLSQIYEYKDGNSLRIESMPESLKEKYTWYENVFDALYQKSESLKNRISYDYKGNRSFEEWCVLLLNKLVKNSRAKNEKRFPSDFDPIKQGISRIRKNLKDLLISPEFVDVVSKIDLGANIKEKGKPYKLFIDKDNIIFPNNEKWSKIVEDKSHLGNTEKKIIDE